MTPEERFWAKVDKTEGGCWLWTAFTDREGYGKFSDKGRLFIAHRWSYEHFVGPIPDGLTIDHLCRVTSCVNPAHLGPVTMWENTLRGNSLSAVHYRKTHCDHGHGFTDENTYRRPDGARQCRTCNRLAVARYKARKRVDA